MFRNIQVVLTQGLLIASIASAQTVIPGGSVSGTWEISGSPYIVEGNITIQDGDTLAIEPGVEVRFEADVLLQVIGYLQADGMGDTIRFTSNLPNPQPGDWDGFIVNNYGSVDMRFCLFEYGDHFHVYYNEPFQLTDCTFLFPVSGQPDYMTMLRCNVNTDLTFNGGQCMVLDQCTFSGYLEFLDGPGADYTIHTCSINGTMYLSDYAATYTVTNTFVGGDVPITIEGTSYFTGCDITGTITGGDVIYIDSCYVGGGIEWQQYFESGSIDLTNSTVNGNILIGDWIYCDMIDNLIQGDIQMQDCWSMLFHDNEIQGSLYGSISCMGPDIEIVDNTFTDGGIDVYFQVDGAIRGNTIYNSPAAGIAVTFTNPSLVSPIIENNTVHASATNGIDVTGPGFGSPSCIIQNNIISSSGGYGIAMTGNFSDPMPPFNDTWNNASGNYSGCSPGSGNLSLDPQFVDGANGDLNLQRISPCIDMGDPNSPLDPDSTRVDMGARYFHQDMPVKLTLTPENPPIVIPATGGSFTFNVAAENRTDEVQTFDLWTEIVLPEWGSVPIMNVSDISIAVGTTIDRDRSQQVPDFAPAGTYTYFAYAGTYPWVVDDYYYFYFEKEGSSEGKLGDADDWLCTGEPFDEISGGSTPALQDEYALMSTYPNPFNPNTVISYKLPDASKVNLTVYDISGRLLTDLVNGWQDAGVHEVVFNGSGLASGIYLYQLEASGSEATPTTATGKMVLMK
ncbi:hypothetical protein CEE37_15070 [candidate division LCP-89 bacterium B3_LCP]|uniref:Secretion system C-terminal sorting domain-containing protein n=1 Tax=candidate division LCP-89 bacterium B3_LCP TaxID=2012998 RepID=A0A532UNS3_UNCL8|nr:MAG: hypothetical protein CEE37_15070 [candidate division LCP-89 bacterium B3_LCP]